jgi:glycosyltransferase involved in cell wall biosynthesis
MKLSVIVATYNRKNELAELFESLKNQTLPRDQFAVVIVDDGSTDGTDHYIEEIKPNLPFDIQYHFQKNKGPGHARTFGMQQADGDIFIFIDSDCIAPPHYLWTIADAFQNEKLDAFGGPDKSADTFSSWDKAVNFTMTSFLTTGGLRGSSGRKLARFYPRSFNMGLRREVFEKTGGFGSIYHYGEDIEFSHRIIQSGAKVAFLEEAYVYHKRRSSPSLFAKQIFKMGRARIQLGKIDRSMLEPLHFVPAILLLLLIMLCIGATINSRVRSLLVIILLFFILFALYIIILGYRQSKDVRATLLIPIVFCIQVTAYGSGMLAESIATIIKK